MAFYAKQELGAAAQPPEQAENRVFRRSDPLIIPLGGNYEIACSAFATESNVVLRSCAVEGKKNEISQIPDLLGMIEIKRAIITIDAIGCQKKITELIVKKKKADYVLALKKNQPDLHSKVNTLFRVEQTQGQILSATWESVNKGHGRIETRKCTCIEAGPWLEHVIEGWTNLRTVAKLESIREVNG